eukprot:g5265.t1
MASASSKIATTACLSAPVSRRPLNVMCSASPRLTRVKQTGVALVGAAILAAASPSFAAVDLALGEEVFDGNCAACHAGGGNTVVAARTLEKSAIEAGLEGGFKESAIIYQVKNGKNAMPAWADRLDDDEIESVAAYVYKQANEALW